MFKELINEIKGNHDTKDKKIAKLKAKAKSKVHCTGDMSPHLVSANGTTFRYVCKPKDKEKARKMKKIIKRISHTTKGKMARQKAQDTKKFRYN